MNFFKTRYDDTSIRQLILDLQRKIQDLELDQEKLKSQIISLRGLINRRSKDIFEDPEPKETIKSPDGLDNLRSANK